jgi:hypothetical protein
MSLWGKTGAEMSVPKYLTDEQRKKAIFIDSTKALEPDNKAKGITCPGWYLYDSFKDSSGKIRHKAELLIPMNATTTSISDIINVTAVEVEKTYTLDFSVQPTNVNVTSPSAVTFTATGSISTGGGTISYQWQESIAATADKSFMTLTNTGIYGGVTTPTLSIMNTSGITSVVNPAGTTAATLRTINITNAVITNNEKYIVTIDTDVFTYVAVPGSTVQTIVAALAGLINEHASYTAGINDSVNNQIDITDGAGIVDITVKSTSMNKRKYRVVITAANAVAETSKFGTLTVA